MPGGDGTGPVGLGRGAGYGRRIGVGRGSMGGRASADPEGYCLIQNVILQ